MSHGGTKLGTAERTQIGKARPFFCKFYKPGAAPLKFLQQGTGMGGGTWRDPPATGRPGAGRRAIFAAGGRKSQAEGQPRGGLRAFGVQTVPAGRPDRPGPTRPGAGEKGPQPGRGTQAGAPRLQKLQAASALPAGAVKGRNRLLCSTNRSRFFVKF